MRRAPAILLSSILTTTTLFAQSPSPTPPANNVVVTHDGGFNGRMESIVVPPIPGAPFSLILAAEWSRSLADGTGTLTLANQRPIMRDGKGRIYQERWFLVPKGGERKSELEFTQIMDPQQHTLYNCFVRSKTCDLVTFNMRSDITYRPSVSATGPLANGKGYVQHENLGVSNTSGEDVTGYRDILTLNPGVMGNDQPLKTTREFWYSARLGFNLVSSIESAAAGKQVFTVLSLTPSEPDPKYFEIPEGYKIVDHRNPETGQSQLGMTELR
ncbi:MAG TPA: hypothetical protein VL495_05715 [Edaphobacter sp.]|nr:hypothetical protein [Edaphobacter sp.]